MAFEQFEPRKHSTLQKRLIKSLKELVKNPRALKNQYERLLANISALNGVYIPENDYQNVFNYTFMLSDEIPEVMKHPRNKMLRELSVDCLKQLEETVRLRLSNNLQK